MTRDVTNCCGACTSLKRDAAIRRVVMFETYDSATDVQSARRFALSGVASLGMCALIGLTAVAVGNQVREVIKEKKVDVVFRPPPPPAPPPAPTPPPPPPPKPKAAKP